MATESSRNAAEYTGVKDAKKENQGFNADRTEWRTKLVEAIEKEGHEQSRIIYVATISEKGLPTVRTCIFRGFQRGGVVIATDKRTNKVKQLKDKEKPVAQVLWYFQGQKQQFRLTGMVETIDSETKSEDQQKIRSNFWEKMGSRSKKWNTGPTPSAPTAKTPSAKAQAEEEEIQREGGFAMEEEGFDNFALLILHPVSVDWSDVAFGEHKLYEKDSQDANWHALRLNP
uniref:Pyridoxamine 5'-phosphate oxidase Alr4036 family FMN-binding domain-containing protein n=1 Tax=Lotharella globosa TaxID=91324 RepID=A0A7S3Z9J6_9EUKA